MRKTLFIWILFCGFTYSQNPIEYDTIIEAKSFSKQKLFKAINEWAAMTFNSANDVIQLSDLESGKVIMKGARNYTYGRLIYNCYDGTIQFTLRAAVKEGKYRLTLLQLSHNPTLHNQCNLGQITTNEFYRTKGAGKRYDNKVWAHLKIKSEELKNELFNSVISKVKTYSIEEKW